MLKLTGAKGGGGSFRNRPDNLRSNDTFEALLGLFTGPIKGLAPGGLKNYFVNDIPMEDGSGNKTFEDFTLTLNTGDPGELAPFKLQLGGSSGSTSIGLAVDNANTTSTGTAGPPGDWRFGAVTTPGVDFIDLRFIVSQLFTQNEEGIYNATASIEIELQPSNSTEWYNPLISTSAPPYDPDGFTLGGSGGGGLFGSIFYAARDRWEEEDPTQWRESDPGFLTITGKTTQAYVKELRISVPNEGDYEGVTWQVRVRLMERDSFTEDTSEERRTIIWESISGVITDEIGGTEGWRGVAYLVTTGKATEQLTGVPKLEGIFDLCKVKVPPSTVWNAETRVYTGEAWDGVTEEISWTQCPAFQLKDLIEDDISGVSALVPGSTLNKWDALVASKWYSQKVPDGNGGLHPRYSMNYLLTNQLSIQETVQYVAGATGSYAWDRGDGHWRLMVEKPENPCALFTKEDIVGEFSYSHTDIDSRYNEIIGVFNNEANDYREDRVRTFDDAHIGIYGRRSTSLALVGCTNRQEALRRIHLRMLSSLYETKQVTFVTTRKGTMLKPFDVIAIADSDLGDSADRTTDRLASIEGTTVVTGSYLRLEPGVDYELQITVPNHNYEPTPTEQPPATWSNPLRTITRVVGNNADQRGDVKVLHLDSELPDRTPPNASVALVATSLPANPKQYRVISLEPSQDNEDLIAIVATEIYTSKWEESDAITEEALVTGVREPVPSPANLVLGVDSYTSRFQEKRVITAHWERPETRWFSGYRVEYRHNGGPKVLLESLTQDNFVEIQEPQDGLYEFIITTIDRRDGESLPAKSTLYLGESPPPGTSRIDASDNSLTFELMPDGTLAPGSVPFEGWARYQVGATDVSDETTWSINPIGCTATIDSEGVWEITDVESAGRLVITGEFEGLTLVCSVIIDVVILPAEDSENSVSASVTGRLVYSATYPLSSNAGATVNSGASGAITFNSFFLYRGDVPVTLAAKLAYRPASGGAWTDVAPETEGIPTGELTDGSLTISATEISGLTASTDYEVCLLTRVWSGTIGDEVVLDGSFTATGNT